MVTFGISVLLVILIYKKKYDMENRKNIIILSLTGIMMLFIAFPIADDWHIILASIVLYIELIYILDFNKIKLESNKVLLGIDLYFILFIILNIIYIIFGVKDNVIKFEESKESKFYLSFVKNYQAINKVEAFIENQNRNVIIISPEAGIYNLNLNLGTHGFYDLPHNGNLGSNQIEKMCDKLKEYEDYYILIHTDKKYIQEIDEFRNYIIENYNKILEIDDYTVYKK